MNVRQINAVSMLWVKFKVFCVCVCAVNGAWWLWKAIVLRGVLLPPTALISLWTLPSSSPSAKHSSVTLLLERLEERQRESETKQEKSEVGRGREEERGRKKNYLALFKVCYHLCACVCVCALQHSVVMCVWMCVGRCGLWTKYKLLWRMYKFKWTMISLHWDGAGWQRGRFKGTHAGNNEICRKGDQKRFLNSAEDQI